LAVGVGIDTEHKQSFPTMPGPNATGSESEGHASVTKRLKTSSESKPRPGSIDPDVAWIFSDHNARANLFNNSQEFTAEALFFGSTGTHCRTVGLAWISANDDIDKSQLPGPDFSNVSESFNIRPMLRENSTCILIDFNLPGTLQSSSLET
jgi:hypothetical protein